MQPGAKFHLVDGLLLGGQEHGVGQQQRGAARQLDSSLHFGLPKGLLPHEDGIAAIPQSGCHRFRGRS